MRDPAMFKHRAPTWYWVEVYRGGVWTLYTPDVKQSWTNPTSQWHEMTWLTNEAHATGHVAVRVRLADGSELFNDAPEVW